MPLFITNFRSPGPIHTRWSHSSWSLAERNSARHKSCYTESPPFSLLKDQRRRSSNIRGYHRIAGPSLRQYQENAGHAPLQEAGEPPQIQMGTAPNEAAPDLSLPERLRRLA